MFEILIYHFTLPLCNAVKWIWFSSLRPLVFCADVENMISNVRISYRMKNIFSVLFPIYLYLQNRGGPFNIMWRRYGIPVKDNLSWISQRFKLNSCSSLEWLLIAWSCASLRKTNISDYSRGKGSKITFLRRGKKKWESGQKEWVREQVLKERVGEKRWPKPLRLQRWRQESDGKEEWECLWWGGANCAGEGLVLDF